MNKFINFLIICLFIIHTNTFGDTEKFGIITRNERWTAENSPYIISDDLLIAENARVTITPGVQILVGKPLSFEHGIEQFDNLDSFTVSIKVRGALKCVGRTDNRIIFSSQSGKLKQSQWYGIILDSKREDETEIAFCDIADACNALTINRGSHMIRNCIFEFNNVGICCKGESSSKIYNCIIAHNVTTGIRIQKANPSIVNNLIVFNSGNGLWSDNLSQVEIEYNCIFGNTDENFSGCNPELGIIKQVNKNKDSTDFAHNLYSNPVFAGSPADSTALEHDVTLQTDKSRVKDTTIAKIFQETLTDSSAIKWMAKNYTRYSLSKYSPCINAGNPKKQFKDMDGSRNDMGIFGGQEFVDFSK